MLVIRNIDVYHGALKVLKDVSLEVHRGELVSILGGNGAGKSTLLGTVAGLYKPRQGEILLNNTGIHGKPVEDIVRSGLNLIPERRQIFNSLTVMDNVILGGYSRYSWQSKKMVQEAREILEMFPALQGKEKRLTGTLSGGEQQMVAIGRGLMSKPEILLMDEPSLGLAPLVIREIIKTMESLKRLGTTIVLVEQNARMALKIADRVYVLESGQVILSGSTKDLEDDPRLHSAYLGTT